MKNIKNIAFALIAATTIVSCERNSTYENVKPSIANIAVSNPSFSTLEAAAVQGGVAVVLSNNNPGDPSGHYTVFAPTNDAFGRLGLTENNLSVLNPTFLTNTLLYHVSNGDLLNGNFSAPSGSALLGLTRRFVSRGNDKFINGSKIVATDISAANGTVHAIDKVMIATGGNIVESALAVQSGGVFVQPDLTYLVAAVVYAGLVPTLANPAANYTVFAPNDAAFIKLFKALGIANPKPSDISALPVSTVQAVLANHVLTSSGMFTSEMNAGTKTSFGGGTLTFGAYNNGVLTVDGGDDNFGPANMVIPDIQATNGVIHIIDTVLMP